MSQKKQPLNKKLIWGIVVLILGLLGIQLPQQLQVQNSNAPKTHQTTSQKIQKNNPGIEDLGKASFTKKELTNQNKGYIQYGALDALKRPTGAVALLKKNMINTGTSANRDIRPPAFISGTKPYFHSRGHLIGRQLGGSGDEKKNLATLYQNPVNTPYMTKYENQVRSALEKNDTVYYVVKVEYEGKELMPKAITMEAKSLTKNLINFHVRIYNQQD